MTTPLLRDTGSVEVHLDSIRTDGEPSYFLQTSPEYAMKTLVANFGRSIYQICPAVRGEEHSHRHRLEFQMLEWYRCQYKLSEMAGDLRALLMHVAALLRPDHELEVEFDRVPEVTYKELFMRTFGVNPHQVKSNDLAMLAQRNGLTHLARGGDVSDYLDGLFASVIEPRLEKPVIVRDYPACQAALSQITKNLDGDNVSARFELFVNGLEIANAYYELDDGDELQQRFAEFNQQRLMLGKPTMEVDQKLLESTGSIGDYSGIALGVDRLAMVLLGCTSIEEVIL